MDLHLVKTETGYAIIERLPGPYSFTDTVDRLLIDLTQADLERLVDESGLVPPVVEPKKGKGV